MFEFAQFMELVAQESGLSVLDGISEDTRLDELDGWSSIYVLPISSEVSDQTGRRVDLVKAFEALTLGDLWRVMIQEVSH